MAVIGNTSLSLRTPIVHGAVAWMVFCAVAVVKTYPLVLHFSSHIPNDPGDPLLVAWILAWGVHALTTDPWNLFHANILYPAENTLALSEHMLGVLPIFAPAYALTGNPIFGYNAVFFLSFPLSGLALFLLVRHWTRHFWASLLAGTLFAFAPIRFGQISHLHLLNLYWAPLALLFCERFLRRKRWRDLAGFAVCYWLQVLCSVYLGWFTTIAIGLYLLYNVLVDSALRSRWMLRRYAIFAAASLAVLLPFHLPYYAVQRQWGVTRSVEECVVYSADLALSYLSVPYWVNDVYHFFLSFAVSSYAPHEKTLFPGLVLLVFAALGSYGRSKWLPADQGLRMKRAFWLILGVSFILSLGPYLIILDENTGMPLPYLLLHRWVPGFQAMRVPARFGFMVMLAASVLAGLGCVWLCRFLYERTSLGWMSWSACQAMVGLASLTLFLLELGFKPLPLVNIETGPEVPAVYRWLAAKNFDGPLLELPLGLWKDFRYAYMSSYHWQPIVNGSSGFMPPTYAQVISELYDFPSRRGIEFLSALGVRGVIVHGDMLPADEVARWQRGDLVAMGLHQMAQFGSDVAYATPSVDRTEQLQLTVHIPDRLPAGTPMKVHLLASGMERRPWMHPRPLGRTEVVVEWVEQQTGRTTLQKRKWELPIAIREGGNASIDLPVRAPVLPGEYQLRLHLPRFNIVAESKIVEVTTDPLPTSLNAPQLLAADYGLREVPGEARVFGPVRIALHVVNSGSALWLAEPNGDTGAVRLGWRWYRQEYHIPAWSGRKRIQYDVSPGQAYEFRVQVPTPEEPGEYILELDMVSELVTWFADQGRESLKFTIRLVHP
jgi:hypothetical protein